MEQCYACKKGQLSLAIEPVSRTVAGHKFTANLPVQLCSACGESLTEGRDLARFELEIANALLASGEHRGSVLAWSRKSLGYRAADLAELLDVVPETISRWENGTRPAPAEAVAVLFALVRDAIAGSTATRDALRAYREPSPLPEAVVLSVA